MSIYEDLQPGDFSASTKKRLPICFCLDTSGSMFAPTTEGRTRMDEVNKAFGTFIEKIKANPDINASTDIAIITFGGTTEMVQKFIPISKMETPVIKAKARSLTPIGEAILKAVELLELRKNACKERGKKYYQPWLVVITDGEPEGANAIDDMEAAIAKTTALEAENKLVVFNIGIGTDVNLEVLKRLSRKRKEPINVQMDDLDSFFNLLGASSESVVSGDAGEDILYGDSGSIAKGPEFDISEWCV